MTNVLVVYKKNFESIHDESLAQLEAILEEMKTSHQLRVELRARERVRSCLLYTSPSPRDLG